MRIRLGVAGGMAPGQIEPDEEGYKEALESFCDAGRRKVADQRGHVNVEGVRVGQRPEGIVPIDFGQPAPRSELEEEELTLIDIVSDRLEARGHARLHPKRPSYRR